MNKSKDIFSPRSSAESWPWWKAASSKSGVNTWPLDGQQGEGDSPGLVCVKGRRLRPREERRTLAHRTRDPPCTARRWARRARKSPSRCHGPARGPVTGPIYLWHGTSAPRWSLRAKAASQEPCRRRSLYPPRSPEKGRRHPVFRTQSRRWRRRGNLPRAAVMACDICAASFQMRFALKRAHLCIFSNKPRDAEGLSDWPRPSGRWSGPRGKRVAFASDAPRREPAGHSGRRTWSCQRDFAWLLKFETCNYLNFIPSWFSSKRLCLNFIFYFWQQEKKFLHDQSHLGLWISHASRELPPVLNFISNYTTTNITSMTYHSSGQL